MHSELEFSVSAKSSTGKGAARKLRADGKTPGVVYGPELEPVMVTFREQDLAKALTTPAQRNVFLRLNSEDDRINGSRVIVKELQVDPVRRVFLHADFYQLDAERKIKVRLPIRLDGTAVVSGIELPQIEHVGGFRFPQTRQVVRRPVLKVGSAGEPDS